MATNYIDRNALIEHIKKDPLFDFVEQYGITGVIESFPAADVQPVKHGGKWVNDIQCSNCGWYMEDDVTMSPMIVFFDYCPNCGARMDGEDNG